MACSGKLFKKTQKICSNTNCGRTSHTIDTCFAKGGGMEGKRDEVLVAKEKAREERNKAPSTAIK
jgi:hypothetical protein